MNEFNKLPLALKFPFVVLGLALLATVGGTAGLVGYAVYQGALSFAFCVGSFGFATVVFQTMGSATLISRIDDELTRMEDRP